jgi:hypothetical protein
MERDYDYENNNVAYDEDLKFEGIKCKNYELCKTILPRCEANYLCTNCHMMFGTWGNSHNGRGILETRNIIECPICLEHKKGISQPRCDHFICIDCFKRCYYGDIEDEETMVKRQPIFPYPDIEEEYFENPKDPRWENDPRKELIDLYNEEFDNWENENDEKYENEENLRKCPLCRS